MPTNPVLPESRASFFQTRAPIIVIGALIATFVASVSIPLYAALSHAARSKQESAKKADDGSSQVAFGAVLLRRSMRDPESFRIDRAFAPAIGTACYDYRSRNGFGGYAQGRAVLIAEKLTLSDSDDFAWLWAGHCTVATQDFTSYAKYVLTQIHAE